MSNTAQLTIVHKQVRVKRVAALTALAGALVAPAAASATTPDPKPVTPVPSLSVQQYLGDWKQIAAIPQWFEALCLSNVNANYRLLADQTVGVTNTCKGPFGANIVARGKARVLDKTTNAQLQVSFVNAFGNWFYPDTKPNYVVVGLDAGYRWAVVGDPDRTSAFVLARSATLSAAERASVLSALDANGFDACKLKTTKQAGGATAVKPFCQAG